MSNCEINNLPVLEVEQHQVREVLRCLLHTIIFNRALGPVKPKEVDSELFDVTYVHCGDSTVVSKVEEKIDQLCTWVDKHPGKRGQVCLSFYEKRKRQNWLGIGGNQEERLFWEQWWVHLSVLDSKVTLAEQSSFSTTHSVRQQRHTRLQAALEEVLSLVVRLVNEKKEHIPPVVSANTLTFPFEISIAGESGSSFGLDTMRRMLMQASPPPVLS